MLPTFPPDVDSNSLSQSVPEQKVISLDKLDGSSYSMECHSTDNAAKSLVWMEIHGNVLENMSNSRKKRTKNDTENVKTNLEWSHLLNFSVLMTVDWVEDVVIKAMMLNEMMANASK